MIELGENEVLVSVTYSTQREYGSVKLSASQTQIVNVEEVSPAAVRKAVLDTLKSEINPLAEQYLAEANGEAPAEEQVIEVDDEDEEEWQPPEEQPSALNEDELEEAAALLAEED